MAYVEKTGEVLEPAPSNAKIYSNDEKVNDMSKPIYATPLSETNTNYAYKLTIGGKDGIIANESMIGYFYEFTNMTSIDLSVLDTSEVTNMSNMFSACISLTSLDVSNFDTSKVTDMRSMFSGCSSLTSLDLSNFDTSQVTSMAGMFSECSSLTILDLSSFDTSKVTGHYAMMNMFCNCPAWNTIDQTKFTGSYVTTCGPI